MLAVRTWLLACIVLETANAAVLETANAAATNLRAAPKPSPEDQSEQPSPEDAAKGMTVQKPVQSDQVKKLLVDAIKPSSQDNLFVNEFPVVQELFKSGQMKCRQKMEAALHLPSSAESLDKEDSDKMLKDLQGEWKVVPVAGSKQTICPGVNMNSYVPEQAVVKDDVVSFSGGQTQKIHLTRSWRIGFSGWILPDPTLYIDKVGTVITNFTPEKGVVSFKNALGVELKWQRQLPERSTSKVTLHNVEDTKDDIQSFETDFASPLALTNDDDDDDDDDEDTEK